MNENVECSETKMNLRVTLDWRTTLATAVLLPTLLFLGFWQLDRADEKVDLIARMEERRVLPPITPLQAQQLRVEELADRQLALNATFTDGHYILLDNRLRSGRFGYEVVAFIEDQGLLVPLNLGWIEGDASRQILPEVSLPVGTHELKGRVYQPSSEAFMLGANPFPAALPGVVQQLSFADWARDLDAQFAQPIFAFEVRVGEFEPAALVADWATVNQTPAKHQGYAVQWFTMAAALALAFIVRSSNIASWLRYRLSSTRS